MAWFERDAPDWHAEGGSCLNGSSAARFSFGPCRFIRFRVRSVQGVFCPSLGKDASNAAGAKSR